MKKSHRQIFRSSAIIGSASFINITLGIIKVKILAVLLGPAGVGLMGLYQNVMSMSSTLAGCGVERSGVRQLAAAADETAALAIIRRSIWLGNLLLGLIGMGMLWLLREPVSQWVFGDITHAGQIGWLGIGVLLTLIASSQTAQLQGLRRIGDLARVGITSATISLAIGILAIYLLEEKGIILLILTTPAVSIPVAGYYVSRLPHPPHTSDWHVILHQWQAMLKFGLPLMTGGLLTLATQLVVRSVIVRELGLEESGYFQAAWAISMTYVGFILASMSADYYPRLTETIKDHIRTKRLVNEQAEMALLLAAPLLLAMITLTPWIIHLLYAENFSPAIGVLRWQVLGDILKVSSWPIGYILLAQGRGNLFIVTELTWNVSYLCSIVLGIHKYGLLMAGIGFWFAYLIYYGVLIVIAAKLIDFKLERYNWLFTLSLLCSGGAILLFSARSPEWAITVGLIVTGIVSFYSLRRLDSLINLRDWIRHKIT